MLRYLVDPIFQVINTAGKPATGGYIEVYVHGTGDKYYCASDFDGTLHPFKIPLDSLGSNIILADDANAYDIYAYNRYGSLLMSRYNVAVSNSGGGGGNVSRKGTIHKLGLWAVDAADTPPKPSEYWIIDLESPNENEPSGYDRLTVEKAREIHNAGAFFGLRTEHVHNPYEDNLLLETYYDYVSMAQTFEVKLANIQDSNRLSEYTLGNFGDYVGVAFVTERNLSVPTASTATPLNDGTASAGSSTQWSRGDHVHPTDTSREAVSNKAQVVVDSSTTDYPSSKAVADFVNSSIATNTANFLGTYDVVEDLGLSTSATNSQIATALGNYTFATTPTNNDYVFAAIDLYLDTGADEYRRFKFNGTAWAYEYTLNNSSFTAAQWDAINSGLSSSDKATYDAAVNTLNAHVADSTIHVTSTDKTNWNAKQDAISTDTDSSTISDATTIATGYGSNKVHLNTAARFWAYIQDKISSVLGLTSSAYGGKAATASTSDYANAAASGSALETALNSKANDNSVVHLAGTETITGVKTFNNATSPRQVGEYFSKQSKAFACSVIKPFNEWSMTEQDNNHFRTWVIDITSIVMASTRCSIVVKLMGSYYTDPGNGVLQKVITFQVHNGNLTNSQSDYTIAQSPCAEEFGISDVFKSGSNYLIQVVNHIPTANNYPLRLEIEVFNRNASAVLDNVTMTEYIMEGWPAWAGDINAVHRIQSNEKNVMLEGDNAYSATDATYSTKIGSSSSHPAIGSATQPVYVDSDGAVKPCENRIHDLTLQRKVIRIAGELTGRNLLCDRQNWTGTVDAPEFTPVDPYVLADWINHGDVIQVDFTTYDWWGDKYPGLIVEAQCSTLSGESRLICTNLSVLRKKIVNGQATVNFAWSDLITDEDTNIKYMEFQSI